jgi:hypothetical protein
MSNFGKTRYEIIIESVGKMKKGIPFKVENLDLNWRHFTPREVSGALRQLQIAKSTPKGWIK